MGKVKKKKSFNFGKYESEFEKVSHNELDVREDWTKVIRYIHYLKTGTDFHRVIIFVKKSDFIFRQNYFDKEEHNFKTDLPHGSSTTNTRPHMLTNKSVKTVIKESTSRPKDVANDLFQDIRGALGVKSTSGFSKSRQRVKDLRRNTYREDDTIKLIDVMKMLNTYKEPRDKKERLGQRMLPSHIDLSNLVVFHF